MQSLGSLAVSPMCKPDYIHEVVPGHCSRCNEFGLRYAALEAAAGLLYANLDFLGAWGSDLQRAAQLIIDEYRITGDDSGETAGSH